MTIITIEVPDDLSEQLALLGEKLPELLRLCVEQPVLPSRTYRYILNFLASGPTAEEIAAFRPTPEMQERLRMSICYSLTATSDWQNVGDRSQVQNSPIRLLKSY